MRKIRLWLMMWMAILSAIAFAQDNTPPEVSFKPDRPTAVSGGQVRGTITMTFAPGLHGYQNPPSEDYMIPVAVSAVGNEIRLVRVEYPKGEAKAVGGSEVPVLVYSNTIRIPVTIRMPRRTGDYSFKLSIRYQQCTDVNCFPPSTIEVPGKIRLAAASAQAGGTEPTEPSEPQTSPDQPVSNETETPPSPAANAPTPGEKASETGLPIGGLLGYVGVGLLLCLTPCVYPVIPITLSFFANQTSGSRAGRVGLGLMYMLGIAVTYGLVGGLAAIAGGAVGGLFAQSWFNIALAVLLGALALSMFGVYEIGIPPALSRHLKGRSGPVGALIMGLMVGVAAAPCAGAAVSAIAIKVAERGDVVRGVIDFTAIGIGLGLPFVALAAFSAGAKTLPKSGGWLSTVKVLLGIAVFYFAFQYLLQGLQFRVGEPRTAYAWLGFFSAGTLAVLLQPVQATRVDMILKGAAIVTLGFMMGTTYMGLNRPAAGEVAWEKFTPESFAAALQTGKPVVVDATADWCTVCKQIDNAVFKKPEGVELMRDVVALKIDWSTGVDPAYMEMTAKKFDIKGLPHIQVFKPNGERVALVTDLRQLNSPQMLADYLAKARQ